MIANIVYEIVDIACDVIDFGKFFCRPMIKGNPYKSCCCSQLSIGNEYSPVLRVFQKIWRCVSMNENDGGTLRVALKAYWIVDVHLHLCTNNGFVGDVFLDGDLFHIWDCIYYPFLYQFC